MRHGDRENGTKTQTHAPAEQEREDLLDDVNGHVDEIHRELAVQVKRTRQIQEQLDELRVKLARLAARGSASSSEQRGAPGRNGDGPPDTRPSS